MLAPQQPVLGGGSDEEDGGKGRRQQRSEVDVFLVGLERRKALREDDRKKEGEQDLHARQNYPPLAFGIVLRRGFERGLRATCSHYMYGRLYSPKLVEGVFPEVRMNGVH